MSTCLFSSGVLGNDIVNDIGDPNQVESVQTDPLTLSALSSITVVLTALHRFPLGENQIVVNLTILLDIPN